VTSDLDSVAGAIQRGERSPLYLVTGDRVLAEPAAVRLGKTLARGIGCEVDIVRRPEGLERLLDDLLTLSLFSAGKVVVAVETAVIADLQAAASLIDEAMEVLPLTDSESALTSGERTSAIRLLQVLRMFQLDPYSGGAEDLLAQLPDWVFQGGAAHLKKHKRKRPRSRLERIRGDLVQLLDVARREELSGTAESAAQRLSEILQSGLPESHFLILAESAWSEDHPVVRGLEEREARVKVGSLAADRYQGWQGLGLLEQELERETGVPIEAAALSELARRTLRKKPSWGGRDESVDSESTARFAAEYRKLATLSGGSRITREQIGESVEDRGEEDVWGILDALVEGEAGKVVEKVERLIAGADDAMATRLSLFALVAGFCRQLAAVWGMLQAEEIQRGEKSYGRFKSRIAPRLQAPFDGELINPLSGIHPYRLHRAYLAASRIAAAQAATLPARVLQTELRLKGESGSPDTALVTLLAELAAAVGEGASGSGP
jgi:DNA polymerase III delta subunit